MDGLWQKLTTGHRGGRCGDGGDGEASREAGRGERPVASRGVQVQRRGRGQEARRAAARGGGGGRGRRRGGQPATRRGGGGGGHEGPGPAAALEEAAAGGAEQRHPLHGVGVQLAVGSGWGLLCLWWVGLEEGAEPHKADVAACVRGSSTRFDRCG